MLAILSAYDENEKSAEKEKVGILYVIASDEEAIKVEVAPYALALARKFNLKKVYLFYGEKGKITYDYS